MMTGKINTSPYNITNATSDHVKQSDKSDIHMALTWINGGQPAR